MDKVEAQRAKVTSGDKAAGHWKNSTRAQVSSF